ncbi:hypothetical protein H310_10443 [Aphanomyces invadans]|uniref:Uncharacterized protein n=1 Tax=Aphanomyces invadans TaxID=157072 RepID=A0A024TQG6_9STRA|nr:hypothetical protein H310_10443 [Aphanomyces invadans]ETV96268.1 hypothetical protein H310_10443 [Aphanomyces invadans]|eukprot:XP_008875060.1 hypothetical protein H310_10443 [Aphanomyces invadans]
MSRNTNYTIPSDVPSDANLVLTLIASYDATFDRRMRWNSQGWDDPAVDLNVMSGELRISRTGNYVVVITKDCANMEQTRAVGVALGQPLAMPLKVGTQLVAMKTQANTVKAANRETKLLLFRLGSSD